MSILVLLSGGKTMSSQQVIDKAKERMDKAIKVASDELKGIRTGRASAGLLDRINVDYYGTSTPIKQVASINVPEPQLITIQPWDKSSLTAIEKAIMTSDLGVSPTNDGNIIRLNMPPLTEERRKELGKVVHRFGEEAKVSVRNVRRDALEELKHLQKEGKISEDDYYREHDNIQKLTDEHTQKVDDIVKVKEEELMKV